jgi:fatty acid desaturase
MSETSSADRRSGSLLRYRADLAQIAMLVAYNVAVVASFVQFDRFALPHLAATVALLCAMAFSVATITHNVVHVTMFRSRTLNRLMQLYVSILYGNSVSVFVRGHNWSHHLHTQTTRDLMRTSKARFRWNFLNQALFIFMVAPAIERSNKVFIRREREADTPWFRQHRVEKIAVLATTLAAFVIDWRAALVVVLVPRLFGLWCIVGINYVQHDGCDPDHPYNHSRNLVSPLLNLWTFNNGYHGLHHLEPGLHWTQMPAEHARRIKPYINPVLDEPSLLAYLWRTCVWPGKRLDLNGNPVVLGPLEPDDDWLPTTAQIAEKASIGSVG